MNVRETAMWLLGSYGRYMSLLAAVLCALCGLALPYFYEMRMSGGIYRMDHYLLWMTGWLCWISNLFHRCALPARLETPVWIAGFYIVLSCVCRLLPDESPLYGLLGFLALIQVAAFIRNLPDSGKSYALGILILSWLVQLVMGYRQALHHQATSLSITGQLYNPGFFANYLLALIPMFFYIGSSKTREVPIRLLGWLAFTAGMVLLVLTQARAALVGSAAGCLFVVLAVQKRCGWKTSWCWMIIPLLVFSLWFLKPDSALGRLTIYRITATMIGDHLWWGVGPARFAATYNDYQAAFFKEERAGVKEQLLADNTFEAFNFVLQLLAEYGIMGALILALLLYRLMHQLPAQRETAEMSSLRTGSMGCLIALGSAGLFSNPFHVSPILLFLAFHVAILIPGGTFHQSKKRSWFISVLVCLFSLLLFTFMGLRHRAEAKWAEASYLAQYERFPNARKKYEQAYKGLRHHGPFLYNYGCMALLDGKVSFSAELLEQAGAICSSSQISFYRAEAYARLGLFQRAEENYLHAISIVPAHLYPKYRLILLYQQWGKTALAKQWIKKTLDGPVKLQTPFTTWIKKDLARRYERTVRKFPDHSTEHKSTSPGIWQPPSVE